MIKKLKEDIWRLSFEKFGSCVYLIKNNKKNILIDVSSGEARNELINDLRELGVKPADVHVIILTHLHWDHIDNLDLFFNAKIYNPEKLNEKSEIKELPKLKIISTPGHSPEGKTFLFKDILFSGDTLFDNGYIGRYDLPGSSKEELKKSLNKINKLKYKILAPGHLY